VNPSQSRNSDATASERDLSRLVLAVTSLPDHAVLDVIDFFDKESSGNVAWQEFHMMLVMLVSSVEGRLPDFVELYARALFSAAQVAERARVECAPVATPEPTVRVAAVLEVARLIGVPETLAARRIAKEGCGQVGARVTFDRFKTLLAAAAAEWHALSAKPEEAAQVLANRFHVTPPSNQNENDPSTPAPRLRGPKKYAVSESDTSTTALPHDSCLPPGKKACTLQ
jgi:hypothetical protein